MSLHPFPHSCWPALSALAACFGMHLLDAFHEFLSHRDAVEVVKQREEEGEDRIMQRGKYLKIRDPKIKEK